jgi:hypothetical protein
LRSILCDATSPLDFDAVIAAIAERYPGTHVVEPDWYAKRSSEDVAVAERLGWPASNPVSDSSLRMWAERGVQRGFQVPICDGLLLYARLDVTGGYFFCRESDFAPGDVEPLISILKQFPLAMNV